MLSRYLAFAGTPVIIILVTSEMHAHPLYPPPPPAGPSAEMHTNLAPDRGQDLHQQRLVSLQVGFQVPQDILGVCVRLARAVRVIALFIAQLQQHRQTA